MSELWLNSEGERRDALLVNPIPIKGGMSRVGAPTYIVLDGRRINVKHRGRHWWGYDCFGHKSIAASGWECELADGSHWLLVRDLQRSAWYGEPVDVETGRRAVEKVVLT